jgi:hypothetical protein
MDNDIGDSNIGFNCNAINADLVNEITYDDPTVFKRLRVLAVAENFVLGCAAVLKEQEKDDIELLKIVADQASREFSDALDAENNADKINDEGSEERSDNHATVEEKMAYDPLVCTYTFNSFSLVILTLVQIRLFSHIANFAKATRPPHRTFQRTNVMLRADKRHPMSFPSATADITVSPCEVNASGTKTWCDHDAFCEVKSSKEQGPKPATLGAIPSIVTQLANYTRLFLSARPFVRFCVGILIFGTEFRVGIFDRDRIAFSPIYDMFHDTAMFVRVVSCLACDLLIEDLGCDSTICSLCGKETRQLTGEHTYLSAVVSSNGDDQCRWCIIGQPVHTSFSLLGRGTHVWRLREYVPGDMQSNDKKLPHLHDDEKTMKTAWRRSTRTSESDIYLSFDPLILGLAKLDCGGNVTFPGSTGYPITVQNLRNHGHNFPPEYENPVSKPPILHRLILSTVARSLPMLEYMSDLDLLTGFRDALQGLCLLLVTTCHPF